MRFGHRRRVKISGWQTAILVIVGLALFPSISRSQAQIQSDPSRQNTVVSIDQGTKIEVPSDDGRTVRAYDVKQLLQKLTRHGRSIEHAKELLVSDLLWVSGTLKSVKASKMIEFQSDGGTIQLGGDEPCAKLRADSLYVYAIEEDHIRLGQAIANRKEYGYDQVCIDTRHVSVPFKSLDELGVQWRLEEATGGVAPAIEGTLGADLTSATNNVSKSLNEPTPHPNSPDVDQLEIESRSVPYFCALLDQEQTKQFLQMTQDNVRVNMFSSPKMTVFNGQIARSSSISRQTVLAVEGQKDRLRPALRYVELGTKFELAPVVVSEGSISIVGTINQTGMHGSRSSRIKDKSLGELRVDTPNFFSETCNIGIEVQDTGSVLLCRKMPFQNNNEDHIDLILLGVRLIQDIDNSIKPTEEPPFSIWTEISRPRMSELWPNVIHDQNHIADITYRDASHATNKEQNSTKALLSDSDSDAPTLDYSVSKLFGPAKIHGDSITYKFSPTRIHMHGNKFKMLAEKDFAIEGDRFDMVAVTKDRHLSMNIEGNAKLKVEDFDGTAATLALTSDEESIVKLRGNARIVLAAYPAEISADEIQFSKKQDRFTAIGNVVFTSKSDTGGAQTITAKKLQWNPKTNEILSN